MNLQSLTLGLVVTAVLIAVGFQILSGVQTGLKKPSYRVIGKIMSAEKTGRSEMITRREVLT